MGIINDLFLFVDSDLDLELSSFNGAVERSFGKRWSFSYGLTG